MPGDKKELTVFVAMPGTDFGEEARWSKPEYVRRFYEKAREALVRDLGRPVRLLVEKERHKGGVIHDTMYREALEADVYLADLTGANPNVFLELGVRFALRRGITVLLAQETKRIPFDVEPLRVIQYADRPEEDSLGQLVEFVKAGLSDPDHCDSPVMRALDLQVVKRTQWEKVAEVRVSRLLVAADRENQVEPRLALLRQAVEEDPWSVAACTRHVVELRQLGRLEEARKEAERGLKIDPRHAPFHQELGLVLGRLGNREEAVAALRNAVALSPQNRDMLSSLGGALRRLALRDFPRCTDQGIVAEAIASYESALALDRHDTYPALNLVRLCLVASRWNVKSRARASALLERLRHLCAFEVVEAEENYWRWFDLADTHLLRGNASEGIKAYQRGIELVPPEHRRTEIEAPLSTLKQLDAAQVLEQNSLAGIRKAIELLEASQEAETQT